MRGVILQLAFWFALAALLVCGPVLAEDLFVSPGGDDAADGSRGRPFATLDRARRAVRELKGRGAPNDRSIVVTVADGWYRLAAPLVFEPADSGTAKAPIVYRAAAGASPIFSGGQRIRGWTVGEDGRWRTTLPDVPAGRWNFSQLFVDDQRRFRSRLPRAGYFKVAESVEPTPASAGKGHDRFRYDGDDVQPGWAGRGDVEMLMIHIWSASRMRPAQIDAGSRTVTFTGRTRSAARWGAFQKGGRYLVVNAKEALSSPGQWHLDRERGELTYLPRPGETPGKAQVVAPRLPRLVQFRGEVDASRWVQHIRFEGLSFAHAAWTLPAGGQSFPQAEAHLPAAIEAVGARGIHIEGCAVRHVGGYALAFGAGCRDNQVVRCELIDLGAGGIKIGQGGGAGSWPTSPAWRQDPEAQVSGHVVEDCTIAHGGRLHPAAVGVWIGHASNARIAHNDIFDFYYTGISVGWTWGYHKPSRSHHNQVVYNHIHTLGQGVLSDLAGVYTLGVSPGTRVNHNRIHHVQSFDYGGWGLYTDEGSSGIEMRNNLVYRTKTGGFHQHYGRDNVVENNILAYSATHQIQRSRPETHRSFVFRRNIVYSDQPQQLGGQWTGSKTEASHNLFWNTSGAAQFPGNRTLEQWREAAGLEANSIEADPLFVDAAKADFRLKDGSPAVKLGFTPFDLDLAGRPTKRTLTQNLPPVPAAFP